MADTALLERRDDIAVLRLNRPDKRNAFSAALVAEMQAHLDAVRGNADIRCLIVTGAGTSFCSGMDLDELQASLAAEPAEIRKSAVNLARLLDSVYTLSIPTIAAINGPAVAGGAGLACVCDLAIAVPTARFGYPEVLRGLVAAMVMPHLLRLVGDRVARHLLLTGELISAEQAVACGLINEVVPDERLMETAILRAHQCALGGPQALASTKKLLADLRK